ncbi:MAG: hypothetical protein QM479_04330 [Pseudomonadota bacterium]
MPGSSFQIVPDNFSDAVVDGIFEIKAGDIFGDELADFAQENGLIVVNGELVIDTLFINGGTLKGSGLIAGNTTIGVGGTLSPGNSPGLLTIDGILNSSGIINLELETTDSNDIFNCFHYFTCCKAEFTFKSLKLQLLILIHCQFFLHLFFLTPLSY